MKKWNVFASVAMLAALTLSAGIAEAQRGKVEITPFVGYRWGGGMSTISGVKEFSTDDDLSYGVSLDFGVQRSSEVNLYWARYSGDWNATFVNGTQATGGPINYDNIQINGTWFAGNSMLTRPYFSAGLGASILSSKNTDTHGFFAVNLGAGIKKQLGDKLALRIDGRWFPTWITTGSGIWCDYYYCYTVGTGEYYDQFQLSGALSYAIK